MNRVGVEYGTVKSWKRSFGFVEADRGGPEIFVHWQCLELFGYRALEVGQRVWFERTEGNKGPRAARCGVMADGGGA
jgi:CspA family cold shock protein